MRIIIICLATIITLSSCSITSKAPYTKDEIKEGVLIVPAGEDPDTGRPLFNVLFPDNKGMENMYAEEIALSLSTGEWQYNDMVTLTTGD